MMVRNRFSAGIVVVSGLLAGIVISACSSGGDSGNTIKPPPSTGTGGSGGSSTVIPTGGTATTGGSGGTATAGAGMGVAPIDGKCGANATKHASDMLCYCQPSTLSACPDGCGDFQTDANHCGNCTTKCDPTAACIAGACAAKPTTVVPAITGCGSISLAVAGGTLYYTDQMHGTVSSVPVAGGTPKMLAMTQMAPTHIEVSGTQVYWLNTGGMGTVTTALAADGTMPKVLATGTKAIAGFTVAADGMLYYADDVKISKVAAPAGGTATEVGHEDTGIPHALAVSGMLVAYPTFLNGDVEVMTQTAAPAVCASEMAPSGAVNSNCGRIARSQGGLYLEAMYIVDNQAYWMNDAQVVTSPADVPTGVNATVVNAGNPNALKGTAMAIVNKVVYMADDTGYIYKAPLMKDSTTTTIARGQCTLDMSGHCVTGPTSITADDTNVYWASGDCAIMSEPK